MSNNDSIQSLKASIESLHEADSHNMFLHNEDVNELKQK